LAIASARLRRYRYPDDEALEALGGQVSTRPAKPNGRRPNHNADDLGDGDGLPPGVSGALTLATGLDAKVLVLNRHYLAIRVTSARRAFGMLFRDLAEVIHIDNGQYLSYDFDTWAELSAMREAFGENMFAHHDWVRSVRFEIAVPKVIRLLGYDRLPKQTVKLNRRNLFARDRNQCQYCGRHFPTSELSIDHVLPRSQGGGDSWTNLVCSCVKCNARKGGRTPDQAGLALVRKPAQPKRNPMISVRLGQDRYESWKAFLDNAYWSVELR
jgi:5-methylcytosine-specific restriction endonuclease McrA